MERKIHKGFRISIDLVEQLEKEAENKECKQTEIVEHALRRYFKRIKIFS